MTVLVTGGAGYIGSHTCVELMEAGKDVVIIDNLANSNEEAVRRVEAITGQSIHFYKVDIRDYVGMDKVFKKHDIDSVIHFAGLKAVGESVSKSLMYYQNNIQGTLTLCDVMHANNVKNMVFSSSATVYGDPATVPIKEDFPLSATNPYGRSKLMIEEILRDLHISDNAWNIALLRYFNPVGAHKSGTIGEDPSDIPNNLMPFISQVAVGKLDRLSVFGDDYPTPDGTGVRDYIHVVDLAIGHLRALDRLEAAQGVVTYNLGTGNGYSVLDMVKAFEAETGKSIAYQIAPRRPGDIATCYADPALAGEELRWRASRSISDMVRDTWKWQSNNPNGYR